MKTLHLSMLVIFVCILSMLIMSPVHAQNDSTFKYDPMLQYGSKPQIQKDTPEQLHKKLVNARDAISNIMGSKMGTIPFNEVGIDEINSTLDVGIDSAKATLSKEQYLQKIKEIVGDIPIKITFGQIHTLPLVITASIPSPLDQFESGILSTDVICKQNLQLVIKSEDGSPACVKPDTANVLIERGWTTNTLQANHMTSAKTSDPFGITALIIYHPPDVCINPPSHSIPSGMPSCPPNNFYLKINSNSTAYLLGYNICDGESCAKSNDLSVLLPINILMKPDYQMIGLPVNLQWKYGDTVHIQVKVSPDDDDKTASLIDLGNSTIVP